jgi:phosphopantothenoylcysteine decarboxylase/phosphopantothenate--cysteine ligase
LATLGERKGNAFLVGFAAETQEPERYAREKLRGKHLDAIAVNDVSASGIGFGTGENALTILWGEAGRAELTRASKREIARKMWDVLLDIRKREA